MEQEPFQGWLLDVSKEWYEEGLYCFFPYDRTTGDLYTGFNFIGDYPPSGKVVGFFHEGGQEQVEKWIETHKDIYNKFKGD